MIASSTIFTAVGGGGITAAAISSSIGSFADAWAAIAGRGFAARAGTGFAAGGTIVDLCATDAAAGFTGTDAPAGFAATGAAANFCATDAIVGFAAAAAVF
jgi:hypothetical protein